jgi:hypothetical protein
MSLDYPYKLETEWNNILTLIKFFMKQTGKMLKYNNSDVFKHNWGEKFGNLVTGFL